MTTNQSGTPPTSWEDRYRSAGDSFLFGTEPNEYLAGKASCFHAGQTALCLADGEGRNSVWLATKGLCVTASEYSATAIGRARQLAARMGVEVDVHEENMLDPAWPGALNLNGYDWVIAVFIQFADPAQRQKQFADMQKLCKPGGRVLLLGYGHKQLEYATGGPSALENLYTADMLRQAFAGWTIDELVEYEKSLEEGSRHIGMSALIGMIAQKPA